MASDGAGDTSDSGNGKAASKLVARVGRERQRYAEDGERLIAGYESLPALFPRQPFSSRLESLTGEIASQVHSHSELGRWRRGGAHGVISTRRGPHLSQGVRTGVRSAAVYGLLGSRLSLWNSQLLWAQGGWENDETAEEAAARESLEEAGVRGDLQARTSYANG